MDETSKSLIFDIALFNGTDSTLLFPVVPFSYSLGKDSLGNDFTNRLFYQINKANKSATYYFTVDSFSSDILIYYLIKPQQSITFKVELLKSIYHDNYYLGLSIGYIKNNLIDNKIKSLDKLPTGVKMESKCFLIYSARW
jgi:hypothetical protein